MNDTNFWAICFDNGDVSFDPSNGICRIYATRRQARDAMKSIDLVEPFHVEKVTVEGR